MRVPSPTLPILLLLAACSGGKSEESGTSTGAGTGVGTTTSSLPSGLFAHWAFDEGSGTTAADSVGPHDGTLTNGPTWTTGRRGQAVLFDGVDDAVDIPDDAAFDFGTGDFTISAWFQTTSAKDHHIVNLRQEDNEPHIELYAAPVPFGYLGTHLMPGDVRISHDTPVDDGQWHHTAVVLENGVTDGYRLYLDGVEVGTNTFSGTLEDWDTVQIGAAGSFPRWFDGAIDEVMMFDRALSAAEIQQVLDYTAGG